MDESFKTESGTEKWPPHITVACVIEKEGKYLMVEERDKTSGEMVFNQPAGHVEAGESLAQAALRETLEETGWDIELIGVFRRLTIYSTDEWHHVSPHHVFGHSRASRQKCHLGSRHSRGTLARLRGNRRSVC